jgi:hypothetical protein
MHDLACRCHVNRKHSLNIAFKVGYAIPF